MNNDLVMVRNENDDNVTFDREPTITDVYNYLMSLDRRLTTIEDMAKGVNEAMSAMTSNPMLARMLGLK